MISELPAYMRQESLNCWNEQRSRLESSLIGVSWVAETRESITITLERDSFSVGSDCLISSFWIDWDELLLSIIWVTPETMFGKIAEGSWWNSTSPSLRTLQSNELSESTIDISYEASFSHPTIKFWIGIARYSKNSSRVSKILSTEDENCSL